jgi:uncharacterized protein YfaT (DUF1175 family)
MHKSSWLESDGSSRKDLSHKSLEILTTLRRCARAEKRVETSMGLER